MNIVICCTPLGREHKFDSELRFPLLQSLFFKRAYPDGNVFLATTPDAKIPDSYKYFFNVCRFDFGANPFALSRQMFYGMFCRDKYFTEDTIFAGSDVLWGNKPLPELPPHKMMMSYRYHPSQPYCSDMVLVKKGHGEFAGEFFDKIVKMIAFLPRKTRIFWADQIAYAIEVGKLQDVHFDGEQHVSPRYDDLLLCPGDEFLYTPNDLFGSVKARHTHRCLNDVQNTDQLLRLMYKKYAIHFKGPQRKDWFFSLAFMAFKRGWIDPYKFGLDIQPKDLFKGGFVENEV